MNRLVKENLLNQLNNFPQHSMSHVKEVEIAKNLENYLSTAERTPNVWKNVKRVFHPVLSIALFLLFTGGLSYYTLQTADIAEKPKTGTTPAIFNGNYFGTNYKFTITGLDDMKLKQLENGWIEFFYNQKHVGGIQVLNSEQMENDINKQNIFSNDVLNGYQYPGRRTVDHQKRMNVTQIVSYYFFSAKTNLNYKVYFYTPDLNENNADKIARSFRIK
ncbi:hypothetical protein [Peribacillus sp. SCS-155]|uniref:hypothetical protein n=1 Tax=Peribacillus sedimenti TaxID=3115297 RepID=UPI003905AA41